MGFFDNILGNLPEVRGPTQKRLSFKEKMKWTGIVLVLFFILGLIPLFGLGANELSRFEFLSIILGAEFGSIISLGIGPIVTASIVLQLLNGSGIVKFDLTSHEGKKRFQGVQKMLSFFFIIFEAAIYVFMGGLSPASNLPSQMYLQMEIFLIIQIFIGGLLIMFMDEVVSKWGFGSGISLFIAAGVSKQIFIRALSWLPSPTNPDIATGAIPALFQSLGRGQPDTAILMLSTVVVTIVIFVMAVYGQAMKVEIPLSFGRVRGHGIRWPLAFIYVSNIPVILIAALLANVQLWASLMQNWALKSGSAVINWISIYIFGQIETADAGHGLVQWVNPPQIITSIVTNSLRWQDMYHALGYMVILVAGSVVFGYFWVQTAGMDARSQARQIMASGLQVPGFRKDQRVLERLLDRYIGPLTIMGSIFVGILAASADIMGALSNGTGILLSVMIIYRLYEDIAKQHMMDMNPMMRRFME
ncbi:MAG: preprotein translocase subunit SecY [archaeon GW2011_AR3]|nr:MAG: preprotein translocase subunit SecY [archaeon GW2011_AR3]MBS3109359.1 preprotein translocase subunit SecY [Candidatus Woesearchaeota archaeon]